MPIEFNCAHCGKLLRTPDDAAGRQAKCPDCGNLSQIPFAAALLPATSGGGPTFGANPEADFNPFQSPTTTTVTASTYQPIQTQDLASLGARLGGAILDNLIYAAAAAPGFFLLIYNEENNPRGNQRDGDEMLFDGSPGSLLLWAGVLAVAIVNWILIAQTGQSIAKKLIGTRIVRLDGGMPGFVYGVVIRSWAPQMIGAIPFIGGLFGLADTLSIFGKERRCIHDQFAGTRVVRA